MTVAGLVRTQYLTLSGPNPTPRTGVTDRAESRTDVEGYVLPAEAARNSALLSSGVAAGLQASAVAGTVGVRVAPGVAFDLDGHVVVLGEGAVAIVDPFVGPTGVQNIPTVPVNATGVVVDTAGLAGDLLLTVTWREVEEATGGQLVLFQAPWLRLVNPATFVEDGLQLVLAAVTLGTGGVVESLKTGSRRLFGVTAGRLELSLPGVDPASGLTAGQTVSGQLASRADGGMELSLLSPAGVTRPALSVNGDTGDVELDAGLRVAGPTRLATGLTVSGKTEVIGEVSTTGKLTAGGDLAVGGEARVDADLQVNGDLRAASITLSALAVNGNVVVQGTTEVEGDVQLGRALKVTGDLRAANTALSALTVSGNVVVQGTTDDGGAFDVSRRMRVRSPGGSSAGIWFFQGDRDQGFVGMKNNTHIGFFGNNSNARWALTVNTENGRVGVKMNTDPDFALHVNGTMCATTFCNPSDARLKSGVADLVDVLDRLAALRAVTYVPIDVEPGTERRQAGVLAQDVVRVFPELVLPMGSDGLMAVDYAGLVGVLVGAVNELRAANAALTSRVAQLDRRDNGDEHRI